MSRMPLVEPEVLPPYLKAIHDATPEENWLGRNFARAFGPNPDLVQAYQAFYHPWHTGGAGSLEPRLKELIRLRIATLNGCVLCKSVRMAPEVVGAEVWYRGIVSGTYPLHVIARNHEQIATHASNTTEAIREAMPGFERRPP